MFPDPRNAELTVPDDGEATAQDAPWRPGDDEDWTRRTEPEEPEAEPEPRARRRSAAPEPAETESEESDAADEAPPRKPRRRLIVAAAVVLVLAVLGGLGSLSSVQTILRQSFTRLPTAYTEMYLSGTPTVSGITLSVPVTVVNHSTTQDAFTLKVWTVNGAGKTDMTTSIKVAPKHGEATVVVKVAVQMPSDAQVLWINLAGQPQTLHYRIAGEAIPSPTATSTVGAKH